MAQDPMVKRPLFTGQFAWAISKKSGSYIVIFGPDPMDATEDELFVVSSKDDPTKVEPVDHATNAIQDFVTIKPGEYAVIHNPTENFTADNPNGAYTRGRNNEIKALDYGSKRVVINGYFPIWPTQEVEVRKIHTLSSNQYLMAVVESENIDTNAPYYDLTLKCASIKKAVINETKPLIDENNDEEEKPSSDEIEELKSTTEKKEAPPLRLGQRIIIPGNLTPTYIPPTGIEIVIENKETVNKTASKLEPLPNSIEDAIEFLWTEKYINVDNYENIFLRAGVPYLIGVVNSEFDSYGYSFSSLYDALISKASSNDIQKIIKTAYNYDNSDQIITEKGLAIQKAVVLGPTEFCVLLDEDGKPQVKKGPGRVFPGPYDVFRSEGSRNRVYDAYHLRPDRGILLRIVVDEIKKEDLINQLPQNCPPLEKDLYMKGDEVFMSGFDAYLIPSPAIEVIDPSTRKPHIGNNHSSIYVQAIGVDQKSGVYVADVETGNIRLVRGEKKLILNPRKEKHIHRRVPQHMWDLIIGRNESHKKASEYLVETPWALSVMIPNNEAVLVTSKSGRRAEVGPKTILLEYEEWLEILSLSRGRPKTDQNLLETCFLRVSGNRSSDQIILETSDFVHINVDVQYSVEFEGDSPEEQIKWFNYKDYVKYFSYHLRSRLRGAARHKTLSDLYSNMADFVRDTILGEKSEDGKRNGLLFKENNMRVTEVDIINTEIPDIMVSEKLEETNRQIVISELQQILDKTRLIALTYRNKLDIEETKLNIEKTKRTHEANKISVDLQHSLKMIQEENRSNILLRDQESKMILSQKIREETMAEEELQMALEKDKNDITTSLQEKVSEIQTKAIEAIADAEVKKFSAIQPDFIHALESLGDKQVLEQLAKSIPAATGELGYLLSSGGFAGLIKMLEGSPFEETVKSLNLNETPPK